MAARSRREKLGAEPKITPGKLKLLQFSACLWSLPTSFNVPPPLIPKQLYTIYAMAIITALPQSFSSSSEVPRGQQGGSVYMYCRYIIIKRSKEKYAVYIRYTYNILLNIPLGQIDYYKSYKQSPTTSTTESTDTHFYTYMRLYGFNTLDARTIDPTRRTGYYSIL